MAAPAIGVRRDFSPMAARIDWSNPFAQGIVNCVISVGAGFRRLDVGSFTPTRQGNWRATAGPYGVSTGSQGNVAEDPLWDCSHTQPLEGVPYSSLVIANGNGGNIIGKRAFVYPQVTGTYGSSQVGWCAQTSFNIRYLASITAFGAVTLDTSVGLNEWFVGTMSWKPSEFLLYTNGQFASSSTNSSLSSAGTRVKFQHDGNSYDGSSTASTLTFACFWNRALTEYEHTMLGANPYCFLRT